MNGQSVLLEDVALHRTSLVRLLALAAAGVVGACAGGSPSEPIPMVASVEVSPPSDTLILGQTVSLTARANAAQGELASGQTFTWTSSNMAVATVAVATVTSLGGVTAEGEGTATIMATTEGVSGAAEITVISVTFASMTGSGRTCGITTGDVAYCWGENFFGGIGNGSTSDNPVPVPVAVSGGLTLASISTGDWHTCGITPGGDLYCWGGNDWGQLGRGGTGDATSPELVSGGLTFASVSTDGIYSCGVITNGAAYCWGNNDYGQVGIGTIDEAILTPEPVFGGLAFRTVRLGAEHACGITTGDSAYCWGRNDLGQLGAGNTSTSAVPVAVSGGLAFASLSVGHSHTCGITTGDVAYCWGFNGNGELGNGTTTMSAVPVAVSGGLTFASVSTGDQGSCGLTASGELYCWGTDRRGQLGNGPAGRSLTPVPVSGGLAFASVISGGAHSCGITTGGVAYCWGWNGHGQLGDGGTTDRPSPVRVLGQR